MLACAGRHAAMARAGLVLLVAGVAVVAAAEPFEHAWRVADVARAGGEEVVLGTADGRELARLQTAQMRRLYAVEQAIEEVAESDAELVVVTGDAPNAFAAVGERGERVVGVNLAMLEVVGEDMHAAAALLGHELAHLKLDHGASNARTRRSGSALGAIGGIVLGGLGVPAAHTLSGLTVRAVQSGYSRDNEREADYLGVIWAIEAGFEAEGAVRLHESLARQAGTARSAFLSSHPSGPERIRTLRALAQRLDRGAP